MNGYVDLQMMKVICEERIPKQRREPIMLSMSKRARRRSKTDESPSGLYGALCTAARAVASFLM